MGQRLETYDGNGNLISVVDTRDPIVVATALKDAITEYRDMDLLGLGDDGHTPGTVWFNGYLFDCDASSRTNIVGVVTYTLLGLTLPPTFKWRDTYNNDITQNNATMIEFGTLMAQYTELVFGTSWYLKGSVDAIIAQNLDTATTLAQLDAFDPTANWPSNDLTPTVAHAY
jgi:hypothetical protein